MATDWEGDLMESRRLLGKALSLNNDNCLEGLTVGKTTLPGAGTVGKYRGDYML
ncbi:MAG: hypothetical protein H6R13_756 [Proteobacteria bacterium]|nr:hypothetical protein [Pseudomonadota bacterium]